jgi:hypothetical protein
MVPLNKDVIVTSSIKPASVEETIAIKMDIV